MGVFHVGLIMGMRMLDSPPLILPPPNRSMGVPLSMGVRTGDLTAHVMHSERVHVDETVCEKIAMTRARGGRVIAVGTTVVRSLESAAQGSEVRPFCGETSIFIHPGYRFVAIDGLLTNFHLPQSTLIMLVCALGGHAFVMRAYRHAVANDYRFFSYGDAMLMFPAPA